MARAAARDFAANVQAPADVARFVRARVVAHLYDETGADARGTAIYTLSDPRDLRTVRYVGQTRAPRRRFLQHVHTARLWLPDDLPWWVIAERYRPLYEWVRALFREERRLPVMIVTAWHDVAAEATIAERGLIQESLRRRMPLLNVESAAPTPQIRLF
jgi:hypothetical protein